MDVTDDGVLSEDAFLSELGECLVTTEAWQRLAVWLLHKHFESGEGDIFLERVSRARQKIVTTAPQGALKSEKGP